MPALLSRRSLLAGGFVAMSVPCELPGITPMPVSERRVGLAYSLWHPSSDWSAADIPKPWGTPQLGYYKSDDVSVLTQHSAWLSEVGVDFVFLDWSNDINIDIRHLGGAPMQRFIETASLKLFDVWVTLGSSPRVAIMIGNPKDKEAMHDGRLRHKADEVYELFVTNPKRSVLLEMYQQKPLLIVYINSRADWQTIPDWQDDRFTVRFMSGFITQQPILMNPVGVSRYGFWSWEDREPPTYSIWNGHPECMTVTAAWRGLDGKNPTFNSPGRQNGLTYLEEWAYARKIGPKFVLAGTFNEWWISEQPTPEVSKDIEPSKEFGWLYMDILKEQAKLFKSGL